ncbi:MAG: NAD(P)-dependent oxidoreductase [bacterium]|nr:NAD(P)-dependent oxidoreductase [bacterium]
MNILLTGAKGFIGKNLAVGLENDFNLFTPPHKELNLLISNDVDLYIKSKKIDVIMHCAFTPTGSVCEDIIRMHINIAKNANNVKKIIYFGSGAEYSKSRNLTKVKENEIGKYIPNDEYGFGKYVVNGLVDSNKNIVNLRLFGAYGKYEDFTHRFISNSIIKNLLHLPIKIKQNVIFDYLYVEDLIPIVKHFIKNPSKYSDYNLTPNESINLKKIAQIINRISDYKSKISIKYKGYNFQYTGDNTRLKKEIRTLKFTSYETGIANLYEFYRKKLKTIDK